jgi:hypothetical protein
MVVRRTLIPGDGGPAVINPGEGGPADIDSSVWSPGTLYPSNQCPVDFNSWS